MRAFYYMRDTLNLSPEDIRDCYLKYAMRDRYIEYDLPEDINIKIKLAEGLLNNPVLSLLLLENPNILSRFIVSRDLGLKSDNLPPIQQLIKQIKYWKYKINISKTGYHNGKVRIFKSKFELAPKRITLLLGKSHHNSFRSNKRGTRAIEKSVRMHARNTIREELALYENGIID